MIGEVKEILTEFGAKAPVTREPRPTRELRVWTSGRSTCADSQGSGGGILRSMGDLPEI